MGGYFGALGSVSPVTSTVTVKETVKETVTQAAATTTVTAPASTVTVTKTVTATATQTVTPSPTTTTAATATTLTVAPPYTPVKSANIGYCAPFLRDLGQVAIMIGAKRGADKFKWTFEFLNADGDVNVQISHMQTWIAKKKDAIFIVPQDAKAISPGVEAANEAGIPVICIDRAAEKGEILVAVMSDNILAGRQAGEILVEKLKEKYGKPEGYVVEFLGALGTDVARMRREGFHEVVEQYPGITIHEVPCEWEPEKARTALLDIWHATGGVDACYSHCDYMSMGVFQALEQLGALYPVGDPKHVIAVNIDGCPEGLDALRKGWLDATIVQPLTDFGVVGAYLLNQWWGGLKFHDGLVIHMPGAKWSPAVMKEIDNGFKVLCRTWPATKDNVDDPTNWANDEEVYKTMKELGF